MTAKAIKFVVVAVFGLGAVATGLACGDLGEVLQNVECLSNSDCGPLDCVVANPPELIAAEDGPKTNITQLGWCREQPSCAVGIQPFCACAIDASSRYVCASTNESARLVPATKPCFASEAQGAGCYCVPQSVACSFPATP